MSSEESDGGIEVRLMLAEMGGGWLLCTPPAHLLGEEGEVLPQLRHTNLQLVALTQQLLLLTHLG